MGDSGLLLVAGEQPKIQAFYLPALGSAPKWCSFLDTVTEELESVEQTSIYDDYKFVTRNELDKYVSLSLSLSLCVCVCVCVCDV
jgi:ribosome biogenesis protein ENP2